MTEPRTLRRLAAILAADVVGYSRLVQADEAGTLAALRARWQDLLQPSVARHRGRVVKVMGDGVLVEFASAVDAVECAVALQTGFAGANENVPDDRRIVLRIGINLGDVIVQGADIYGDGVNVAARLEAIAEPGGISVSAKVFAEAQGKVGTDFAYVGEVALKNIAVPVQVYAVCAGGKVPAAATLPGPPLGKPSIAVLAFENMSADPDQEYFSDGISEDIITDLSKVPGLIVVARNSSFAYKGKSPDIRQVGRELGVAHVLEGSIRRAGNRLRIAAQLVDAATGGHLWAERYDRHLTDIFALQDEVATQIVTVLRAKLHPLGQRRAGKGRTADIEAHDAYLRGREHHNELFVAQSGQPSILAAAKANFERAITLDQGYALPYANLGLLYVLEHQNHWAGTPNAIGLAVRYSSKAVEIGPDEAFAHYSVAIASLHNGDVAAMKTAAHRALALDPNLAIAYGALGNAEIFLGDPLAALPYYATSIRLDPMRARHTMHFMGLAYLVAGDHAAAAAQFRERIRLTPRTDFSRAFLCAALGHLGELEEARRVWRELMEVKPDYDLDEHLARLPWHSLADAQGIRQGLAKAGLPL